MDEKEKFELIKRNVQEIITEEELLRLLENKKRPVVYCGYEPSGSLHLGHFVTITKLQDFEKAGFKIKILLADVHAFLNRKGEEEKIQKEITVWKKIIQVIGLNADIILGSSFQFEKDYQEDVMKLAREITINRGLRSMQQVARDIENATISQVWYPLMQIVDIKKLGADIAYGGIEQRKIHMLGREMNKILNHHFIAVHTPLITSLKGGEKMSKSIPGSGISIIDSYEEIKKSIKNAYCPEKIIEGNPILDIIKLIIFPKIKKFRIERPLKFGGNLEFLKYEELEKEYSLGKIHPLDLKNSLIGELDKILEPIRKNLRAIR